MNMTKRVALLGGVVTASLVAAIPAATAWTEPPPTMKSPADPSASVDSVAVGSGDIRLTWLIRPRPAHQRSSTV